MTLFQSIVNRAREISSLFPGYFEDYKHNHYRDFGYPTDITFALAYSMYCRNGLGSAAVEKTILKTWETSPALWENESPSETRLESDVAEWARALRLWTRFAETDRRSLVGGYSAAILRLRDSKSFKEPVDRVPGGLDGLSEIIPAWAGQLGVSTWDTDEASETYGQPTMFAFNEAAVGDDRHRTRAFEVHPDRVIVWSRDGTVHARSALEPGYNDLITLEKVNGAGGEGFWKNAKSAPVIEVDKEANIQQMAAGMGVSVEEVAEKMDAQVDDFQKGFDKMLMLQGMQAKTLGITLPSPEHFHGNPLMSFAASFLIPLKILTGSQTGERASTEDAVEWAKTNMARRNDTVLPGLNDFIRRMKAFGILSDSDWQIGWADLTESSMSEKIDRADKMAGVNQKSGDEPVFFADEIREAVGLPPQEEIGDDE